MHLSPNLRYPWVLRLTHRELTVIQRALRDDEMSEDELDLAAKLANTLDLIRPKAERTMRKSARRAKPRDGWDEADDDDDWDDE